MADPKPKTDTKGVEVIIGSMQYRNKFQVRGWQNEEGVFEMDPAHVFEADHDMLGDVVPGMVMRISEDYAAHLCDGKMNHSKPRGRPAKVVRLATRLTDTENARKMLDAFRAESLGAYGRIFPRGHEALFIKS